MNLIHLQMIKRAQHFGLSIIRKLFDTYQLLIARPCTHIIEVENGTTSIVKHPLTTHTSTHTQMATRSGPNTVTFYKFVWN